MNYVTKKHFLQLREIPPIAMQETPQENAGNYTQWKSLSKISCTISCRVSCRFPAEFPAEFPACFLQGLRVSCNDFAGKPPTLAGNPQPLTRFALNAVRKPNLEPLEIENFWVTKNTWFFNSTRTPTRKKRITLCPRPITRCTWRAALRWPSQYPKGNHENQI